MLIHLSGLKSSDPAVFDGKKRTIHVAAQGTFSRPCRCAARRQRGCYRLRSTQSAHIPTPPNPTNRPQPTPIPPLVATRLASQCTGQEFNVPIHGGKTVEFILEQILRACAKVFTKTTRVDAHCERPYFLNPLCAAAQLMNVSLPGQEPDIWDVKEDCRCVWLGCGGGVCGLVVYVMCWFGVEGEEATNLAVTN